MESRDKNKLNNLIVQLERLFNEKEMVNEAIKDTLKEAELQKFSTKIIKLILKRRKIDRNVLEEEESLLHEYESLLSS